MGHITHYNFSCDECGQNKTEQKVKGREHVDFMRKLHVSAYDYHETMKGGVSVYEDIFKFYSNGSIHEIIHLPDQQLLEKCQRITSSQNDDYIVTACQVLGAGVNLYVTSGVSFKAWTWGPYRTGAFNIRKLQINGDILMLTDTSTYPEFKFEKGKVFLFALAFDHYSGEEFDEL